MKSRLVIAFAMIVAACGTGADTGSNSVLPPSDLESLTALVDPLVAPLGYHVTRGGITDRSTPDTPAAGSHLAIYVAPDSHLSADQIAADFPAIIKVFLPLVFDRWSGLESFDVCQEPFESPQAAGPTLTLFDITRETAAKLNWSELDLADIIALADMGGIGLYVRPVIQSSETWEAAAGTVE